MPQHELQDAKTHTYYSYSRAFKKVKEDTQVKEKDKKIKDPISKLKIIDSEKLD